MSNITTGGPALHENNPQDFRARAMENMAEELRRLQAENESLKEQLAARVPEGWKLVPVVLTQDFVEFVCNHGVWTEQEVKNLHEAMLSAAPSQPAPSQSEPMTDEQIDLAILDHCEPDITYRRLHSLARAIERHHKIGGKQ